MVKVMIKAESGFEAVDLALEMRRRLLVTHNFVLTCLSALRGVVSASVADPHHEDVLDIPR